MASNFTFGQIAVSEVNKILLLLAQSIVLLSLYPIIFQGYWGHISIVKYCWAWIDFKNCIYKSYNVWYYDFYYGEKLIVQILYMYAIFCGDK